MNIRLAIPADAEACWNIRNQAIRHGCKRSYAAAVIDAWTPDTMPESYRAVIAANPFFIVEGPDARPAATGYLDLTSGSVETVFTLTAYTGWGFSSQIINAIKDEARKRGFKALTLSSTPNAPNNGVLNCLFFKVHSHNHALSMDTLCRHLII